MLMLQEMYDEEVLATLAGIVLSSLTVDALRKAHRSAEQSRIRILGLPQKLDALLSQDCWSSHLLKEPIILSCILYQENICTSPLRTSWRLQSCGHFL